MLSAGLRDTSTGRLNTYQMQQIFPNTRLPALDWQSSHSVGDEASPVVEGLWHVSDLDPGRGGRRLWHCRTGLS